MTTWISQRFGQFTYFDEQLGHPAWAGKKVLDFGGNVGNLLVGEEVPIAPVDYWSMDVSRDAIVEGQRRHPDAHFIFYDRYNFEYNPTGRIGLPLPDPGVRFDVIVAWSVFTHNNQAELLDLVGQARTLLAPGGSLAFSFLDPQWTPPPGWARPGDWPGLSNLHRLLMDRKKVDTPADWTPTEALTRAARRELTYVTLVNSEELCFDPDDDGISPGSPPQRYIAFCTVPHMHTLFPDAVVLPPVRPERQHCVVLRG
ncbi:MAG TPA: class I SAM-dependent methyltransferase [Rugosimonospora sp.]|nr:class I SAM-dependent methyltransferase [Rugosimonospora sp.]